jgi:hypothetical protein
MHGAVGPSGVIRLSLIGTFLESDFESLPKLVYRICTFLMLSENCVKLVN